VIQSASALSALLARNFLRSSSVNPQLTCDNYSQLSVCSSTCWAPLNYIYPLELCEKHFKQQTEDLIMAEGLTLMTLDANYPLSTPIIMVLDRLSVGRGSS